MVQIKWAECLGYPTRLLPEQEFIGQIIDIFEDFLDDHKVILDNPERSEGLLANWGIMTWVEVRKNDPLRSNEGQR